jgi:hypothetical protein
MYRIRLVVVSELPKDRDTLLLRLLGSGRTLREASRELAALPEASWEHQTAERIVPLLGLNLNQKEESPMMQPYQRMYEDWVRHQQAIGEAIGEVRGIQESLLQLYRVRFSTEDPDLRTGLLAIQDPVQLRALLPLFAQGSREDIRAALSSQDS